MICKFTKEELDFLINYCNKHIGDCEEMECCCSEETCNQLGVFENWDWYEALRDKLEYLKAHLSEGKLYRIRFYKLKNTVLNSNIEYEEIHQYFVDNETSAKMLCEVFKSSGTKAEYEEVI